MRMSFSPSPHLSFLRPCCLQHRVLLCNPLPPVGFFSHPHTHAPTLPNPAPTHPPLHPQVGRRRAGGPHLVRGRLRPAGAAVRLHPRERLRQLDPVHGAQRAAAQHRCAWGGSTGREEMGKGGRRLPFLLLLWVLPVLAAALAVVLPILGLSAAPLPPPSPAALRALAPLMLRLPRLLRPPALPLFSSQAPHPRAPFPRTHPPTPAAPPPPPGITQQYLPGPGALACGQAWSNTTVNGAATSTSPTPAIVDCGAFTIASINFVYYGNPTGSCWAATRGSCNSATAQGYVTTTCVGRQYCYVVRCVAPALIYLSFVFFPTQSYAFSSLAAYHVCMVWCERTGLCGCVVQIRDCALADRLCFLFVCLPPTASLPPRSQQRASQARSGC